MKRILSIILVLGLLFLAACGDGGGGDSGASPNSPNVRPDVVVGPDHRVSVRSCSTSFAAEYTGLQHSLHQIDRDKRSLSRTMRESVRSRMLPHYKYHLQNASQFCSRFYEQFSQAPACGARNERYHERILSASDFKNRCNDVAAELADSRFQSVFAER